MTLLAFVFFPALLILPVAAFAAFRFRSGWSGLIVFAAVGGVGLMSFAIQALNMSRSEHVGFESLWILPVMSAAGYGIALMLYLVGWYIWVGEDEAAG